jgi:hypothetical protein
MSSRERRRREEQRERDRTIPDNERRRWQAQRLRNLAHNESLTIAEWCALRKVSRAMLYKLWAMGLGPRRHYAGTKVLISPTADAKWLAEREAAAN